MRILSWNINGVRTLPQYHPWNTFKIFEGVLEALEADIICFQEMKTTRTNMKRDVALSGAYDSFFSFPTNKGGYSGVAVYNNSRQVVPLKAEEGLSGRIQPKPPFELDERISRSYPYAHEIPLMPDGQDNTPSDLLSLDSEGRALVLDFGLFVLINIYAPNETSDQRLPFKMNYHLMLQERVKKLIEEGREVIVVGDMNICAAPIDHCDGHLPSNRETFYDHPARQWYRNWLEPRGPMIDVLRRFWPERKGMYTCWNTKIGARETNYGTRVDCILATRGLMKWIKHGDIQPSIKGSDHCPMFIDLHNEIISEDTGETTTLRAAMCWEAGRQSPRLAAKYWSEYSGKQQLLSSFFGKGSTVEIATASDEVAEPTLDPTVQSTPPTSQSPTPASSAPYTQPDSSRDRPTREPSRRESSSSGSSKALKRKESTDLSSRTGDSKKRKSGQSDLKSFFFKSAKAKQRSKLKAGSQAKADIEVIDINEDDGTESHLSEIMPTQVDLSMDDDEDPDFLRACQLSLSSFQNSEDTLSQSSSKPTKTGKGKEKEKEKIGWDQLFVKVQPPKCIVHNEPTKLYTVNKPGLNKGKTFFICSRPVGPGYDKGKGERLREEVDPRYRCNFFKWANDVRRESMK